MSHPGLVLAPYALLTLQRERKRGRGQTERKRERETDRERERERANDLDDNIHHLVKSTTNN